MPKQEKIGSVDREIPCFLSKKRPQQRKIAAASSSLAGTPQDRGLQLDIANSVTHMASNGPNTRILLTAAEVPRAELPVAHADSQAFWIQRLLQFEDPQIGTVPLGISSSIVHSQSIAGGRRKCDDEGDMKKAKEIVVNAAPGEDLLRFVGSQRFGTILCDPPWQFQNRTGKIAPEHKRLSRYGTLHLRDIISMPVPKVCLAQIIWDYCPDAANL